MVTDRDATGWEGGGVGEYWRARRIWGTHAVNPRLESYPIV